MVVQLVTLYRQRSLYSKSIPYWLQLSNCLLINLYLLLQDYLTDILNEYSV